jgi:hypothetical protein
MRLPRSLVLFGWTLILVGVVNFVAFLVIALAIGGDAISGKVEDGRYLLANNGRYTEVPRAMWNFSRAHTMSVFVTSPLIFVGGAIQMAQERRSKAA